MQGLSKIKNFTLVLKCLGYLFRDKDDYTRNISFNITVNCVNGNYTCTAPGKVGSLDEESGKGIETYITSVSVVSLTFS